VCHLYRMTEKIDHPASVLGAGALHEVHAGYQTARYVDHVI
jgi:hypothetical protein